jgi:hypothetical protein
LLTRYLKNKAPTLRADSKTLDFKGRATLSSVKNVILVDEHGSELLLFGKFGEDAFHLDVSSPLSLFGAFAVAIASCDFSYR